MGGRRKPLPVASQSGGGGSGGGGRYHHHTVAPYTFWSHFLFCSYAAISYWRDWYDRSPPCLPPLPNSYTCRLPPHATPTYLPLPSTCFCRCRSARAAFLLARRCADVRSGRVYVDGYVGVVGLTFTYLPRYRHLRCKTLLRITTPLHTTLACNTAAFAPTALCAARNAGTRGAWRIPANRAVTNIRGHGR